MDPTANINALRQYMDFYRQNNPARSVNYHGRSAFDSTSPDSSGGQDQADAMRFAQGMMQQGGGAPDFYNNQTPGYTPPQPVQGIAAGAGFPLAPQDQQGQMRRPESSQLGMAQNFLRNLFSRR